MLESIIKSITKNQNRVNLEFKEGVRLPEVSSIVSDLLFSYFSDFSTAYYPSFQRIEIKRANGNYVVKGYNPDRKVLTKRISEKDGIALGFIKVRASGEEFLIYTATIQMRKKGSLGQRFCIDYQVSGEVAQKFMIYVAFRSGLSKHSHYPLPNQHRLCRYP